MSFVSLGELVLASGILSLAAVRTWRMRQDPLPGEGWPFKPLTGDVRVLVYSCLSVSFALLAVACAVAATVIAVT